MTEREQLVAAIDEARLRLRDLTREIDESPEAEEDPAFARLLDEARTRVVELERTLTELDSGR